MNLEQLRDQYVIISAEGAKALEAIEDLRELEGDFGRGIKLLWSDGEQSIVAYAFAKSQFDQSQAQMWVDEYTKAPAAATVADIVRGVIQAVSDKFGKNTNEMKLTTTQPDPVQLIALSLTLGDGDEAAEDDDLTWKEIIHPGQWFKRDSGDILEITADIIASAYQAFKDGLPKYVSVPATPYHPHTVPVNENRGFAEKLKLVGERLFAGFRFTDPATAAGVEDGSIADVSVYLEPDATHPTTGKVYDWILTHVLLTNNPLVQDLEPFGAPLPASANGTQYQVTHYAQKAHNKQEVTNMANENISAEALAFAEFAEAQGLSVSDVQTMLDERATAQAALQATRAKARGLEITRIVRALEGVETHAAVMQVENTRHWPVVIAAVETALREQPETMALSADDDGGTSLDTVLMAVVNAIPAEGRMVIEAQPTGAKEHEDPTLDKPRKFTDEEIRTYAAGLHPSRGAR